MLSAFTVPLICQPLLGQPVEQVVKDNSCFSGPRRADYCNERETLDGHTIREAQGPTAVHTKLGWVLSGPVCNGNLGGEQSSNLVTTQVLKCATEEVPYQGITEELKEFWDLQSLGVRSPSLYQESLEKLSNKGDHYEVN